MEKPVAIVEKFLAHVRDIRASGGGTKETSYYAPLSELLSGIGHTLRPKVICVIQLKNRGAGLPDGGLFTKDQLRRVDLADETPFFGQAPARGVIEVKSPAEELQGVIASDQVAGYWKKYGLVLVTNLRQFALVGRTASGQPAVLERFDLAHSDAGFWSLVEHPRKAAEQVGSRFAEYLLRVLLHQAPLTSPQDVASLLASYARDAKARIDGAELPALAPIRGALEEALGLRFEGDKGEHFFRSTLVQTLFYGVFSAWVLWARRRNAKSAAAKSYAKAVSDPGASYGADSPLFDWRTAQWLLRVPMLRALFMQVADPGRLGALGLIEVLDWTAAALNRVDRAAFFASFDERHAVQYFYEPFLEAFDPELRKELGVWYTPEEIVEYQVERVDTVLRTELDIPDGLADPRVVVLDPCEGTGAYLRAVLRRIAVTLQEKGGDALVAQDLKKAAMERVFGFEILPAPFVIAHMQLGLLLEQMGAPLSDAKAERVGVYLTNALTGWEPPKEPKKLLFPELEQEREAAERVKLEQQILVVLGNPPYNGYAGVVVGEERDLSAAYRTTHKVAPPQGQGLNDLFIRFFRMAERRIVERTGRGVVCFISNYSWLDGLSFTGMRERYLECFDDIAIDCLNGDKYKTGKLTPEGEPDPSVFSTEFNREGIQVGTAIATLVKREPRAGAAPRGIRFRHFWGKNKRSDLLQAPDTSYASIFPRPEMGLSFMPAASQADYFQWPTLPELFPKSFPGVKTSRDDFLVAIDREELEARLKAYFDPSVSHEDMRRIAPGVMTGTARYDAETTRDVLRKRGMLKQNIVRYAYRPLDVRWLYWEPVTKLLDEKRVEYWPHVVLDNCWIEARQKQTMEAFDRGYFTRVMADNFGNGLSSFFPLFLVDPLHEGKEKHYNLVARSENYLKAINAGAEDLFFHVLAVLNAPAYRTENSGALRQDWPRVPLPESRKILLASATLGRKVAALLDVETPVPGVTTGKLSPELRGVASFARADGKAADPDAGDLDLTAGWGHAGKGGVTMPGRGRLAMATVEHDSDVPFIDHGTLYDVYLNDRCLWRNIPDTVWDFTVGGYQVIKKWLSYREKPLLGRGLTIEEVRYVTEMARRLAALVALQPALDESYLAAKKSARD